MVAGKDRTGSTAKNLLAADLFSFDKTRETLRFLYNRARKDRDAHNKRTAENAAEKKEFELWH